MLGPRTAVDTMVGVDLGCVVSDQEQDIQQSFLSEVRKRGDSACLFFSLGTQGTGKAVGVARVHPVTCRVSQGLFY